MLLPALVRIGAPAAPGCEDGMACVRCPPGEASSLTDQARAELPQQPRASCTGGHGTEPYEQNTQQSPDFGLSSAWQPPHRWKYRHASVGIVSTEVKPQCGQVSFDSRLVVGCMLSPLANNVG
jgi:hypothetical protein